MMMAGYELKEQDIVNLKLNSNKIISSHRLKKVPFPVGICAFKSMVNRLFSKFVFLLQ